MLNDIWAVVSTQKRVLGKTLDTNIQKLYEAITELVEQYAANICTTE